MGIYVNFTQELKTIFEDLLDLYIAKPHDSVGAKTSIKADTTPVVDLDNHALARLRALITSHFPGDYTIGEEDKKDPEEIKRILENQSQPQWTIDGLDGTWSFIAGTNSFGAAVSRRIGKRVDYAAAFRPIDMVLRQNGFIVAEQGVGTLEWCGMCEKFHALETARPGQSRRLTVLLEGSSKRFFSPPVSLLGQKVTTRPSLSSCIASTTVARGNANAVVTIGNKPWDNWPTIAIVEGAGGVITDHQGKPYDLAHCEDIVAAANAEENAQIVALLNLS